VQADLAKLACLAACSKLREARHDAVVNADTLREGVQKLLHDVKEVFRRRKPSSPGADPAGHVSAGTWLSGRCRRARR
jgi:hypothetical protein